ncbi:sugar phosphate isomerase/epimerase [Olsenella sp. Marseille-P4559]|uniref:sugar phosphate isomerase/epimerase family protein n=1 Tax=Olsenella sp. Marseille-P4559 TaxID=2364795 RepID=UPI0013EF29EB|nr:sugar phosphate isomerase/epimerase family protein [Olsenella sp. Marseille-P4559]
MSGKAVPLGVRLHDVEGNSLEERIRNAADLGFSTIHLASKLLYRSWGCTEEGLTEERAKRLRDLLEETGLGVAVYGCYKNLATPDPAEERDNLKEYAASARFARWVGAGAVGSETGRPNKEKWIGEDRFSEAALETLARQAREVACCVADEGSRLALEPGWNEVACTPERARDALEAIGRPDVCVILDPVSLLHPAALPKQGETLSQVLELLGERIAVLHAKDYEVVYNEDSAGWCDGSGSRLVCHGVGTTGAFDFAPVIRWDKESGRACPVIVENGTPDTFPTSLAYLRGLSD